VKTRHVLSFWTLSKSFQLINYGSLGHVFYSIQDLSSQAQKPLRERRPVPQAPKAGCDADSLPLTSMSAEERHRYNEAANEQFLNESRVPCPNCGRKFAGQDRLVAIREVTPAKAFENKGKQLS
jgi:hypothetical protein